MNTVHFRVGETAGKLLMDIAQEHLLYEYNPTKALDTITESLGDCSEDLAKKILIGDIVLRVDVEEQVFIAGPREDADSDMFPKINVGLWCKDNKRWIVLESKGFVDRFSYARHTLLKCIDLRFRKDDILLLVAGNPGKLIGSILENDNVAQLQAFIKSTKKHIKKSYNIINVINALEQWYPEKCIDIDDKRYLDELIKLEMKLHDFLSGRAIKEKDEVEKFVDSSIEISKVLSTTIKPVDLYDNYTAGWLSPEGDYYALNGEIANMLHLNIAASLYDAGIIPKDSDNNDSWLEQHGWVKIHGNNIQFAGCLNHRMGFKNVDLTSKQIKMIYDYGQRCHQGILKMGWRLTKMSAARFELLALSNLEKLYDEYFQF
jgi:hypothetical protein